MAFGLKGRAFSAGESVSLRLKTLYDGGGAARAIRPEGFG
jgi:hypothetical protein